jgi:hypothetical protein
MNDHIKRVSINEALFVLCLKLELLTRQRVSKRGENEVEDVVKHAKHNKEPNDNE